MKKKILICFSVVILSIFQLYYLMFINTNQVVDEVYAVMSGNVDVSVTNNTPLEKYNYSKVVKDAKIKVKIHRLFVLHNFIDGYMWVNYSYETVGSKTDINPGAWNVVSKWKIHRNGWKWNIVEITERP